MKEESFNIPSDSLFVSNNNPPDECLEENNFLSPQVSPENIFEDQGKDTSETQLSSIILGFPFTLDSYHLLKLKDQDDPELGGIECNIILGNLDKIRYNEPILKLIFFSKDRKSPLKLNDYPNEMNSLTKNMGIEFISIFQNKLFIQCDSENGTNEAYSSLQKSSTLLDLLYDEERSINSLEDQNKGINSLFNSDKKNNNEQLLIGDILLSDKKEKNTDKNKNSDTSPTINNKNVQEYYNFKETNNIFFNNDNDNNQKNIWNDNNKFNNSDEKKTDNSNLKTNEYKNININPYNNKIISQTQTKEDNKDNTTTKQKITPTSTPTQNQKPPIIYPHLCLPILLPLNNIQKIQPQINPTLMMQIPKMNPFLLQTALNMQNIIKTQQLNQKSIDNKDKEKKNININRIKNFNGKDINNNAYETNESETFNKESSTNSNTSSGQSKDSSPSSNYQIKNNANNSINNNTNNFNNMNFNLPNINFGLFNGLNMNNSNNINTFQNINLKSNNTTGINKDIINNLKINDNIRANSTSNLEQIVLNKQYKEYIPKNSHFKEKEKDKEKEKEKEKENGVEFHTNSTRDYQFKYVSRYIVQIENEKNFPVTKMIIGNNGKLLRQILLDNCINYGDHTTKIRLRGRGSGYKEGPKSEESKDPMELCISSLNMISYLRCSQAIENLLLHVYYQYYLYQCNIAGLEKKDINNNLNSNININNKEIKDKNGCPIVMKKILKYQYVVNRFNTLIKEEKRRKKEEELKNENQNNL